MIRYKNLKPISPRKFITEDFGENKTPGYYLIFYGNSPYNRYGESIDTGNIIFKSLEESYQYIYDIISSFEKK